MMGLAHAQMLQGRLQRAAEVCQQGLQLVKTAERRFGSVLPAAAYVQLMLGKVLREWDRLDEAAQYLEQCIELCRVWQIGDMLCAGYLYQARLRKTGGDYSGAIESIQQAERLSQAYQAVPWAGGPTAAVRAQVALAQARSATGTGAWDGTRDRGALDVVERWAEESELSADISASSLSEESAYLIYARLLLARNEGERALKLLTRLRQAAEDGGRTGRVIEMLALQALAQEALGDSREALRTLTRALSMAEPAGYVRLFVDEGAPMASLLRDVASPNVSPDYVEKLLEAIESETGSHKTLPKAKAEDRSYVLDHTPPAVGNAGDLIEPLSSRELDVLRLVAAGLSNREIAGELTIAISTVKTHVKNIHAKLAVRNRTQAVARARELSLLS
jgi:LuxR family maltose regulon positive regulatory protein